MYGIQRVEKYKRSDVVGLQREANRELKQEQYVNDVDLEKSRDNIALIRNRNWLQKIRDELAIRGIDKVRKDAILMIGSFYGASGELFEDMTREQIKEYFKDCLEWHIKTYCDGDKDLVVNAIIHLDETTPHMHVESIPITQVETSHTIIDEETNKKTKVVDGYRWGLSAKNVLGNVKSYTQRVDSFYEDVSKKYGLERGEHKTDTQERAQHKTQLQHKIEEQEVAISDNNIVIEAQYEKIETLEMQIQGQESLLQSKMAQNRKLQEDCNYMDETLKSKIKEYYDIVKTIEDENQNHPKYIKLYQEEVDALRDENQKLLELEDYAREYVFDDGLSFYDVYEMEHQPDLDDIVAKFFEDDEYDGQEL